MQKLTMAFLIFLLVLPSSMVVAQEQQNIYQDPEGRYTVPIPEGWNVSEQEGYIEITSPEEDLSIYVTVQPLQNSIPDTIAQAWNMIDPAFDLEQGQVVEPPPPSGIEQIVVITYQAEDRFAQAVGSQVGDEVFVMLIDGTLTAIQTRTAQVNVIANGFDILATEDQDLSDIEPIQLTSTHLDQIETYINNLMPQFEIPGASVAIVQNGEIIYTGGFGVTVVGGEIPVTPTTQMMIGSTGKSMTTAMMASMIDDGLFNWDTPVVEILPEFQFSDSDLTQQITMRNLVCACSGVPRRDVSLLFNAEDLTAEEIVKSLATFELLTGFGETFQYSNQMVATGGYAAVAATDVDFGNLYDGYVEELNERIIQPIGMPNTTLSFDEILARGEYAMPHALQFGFTYEPIPLERERFLQPVAPAGGHWSTVEDMARYMIFQMQNGVTPDGEQIVSEENLLATREAQVAVSADVSYGLGWFIGEYEGIRLIEHGGNTIGFSSSFGFLPEKNIGVVVLMNAQASNLFGDEVRDFVFDLAFDNYDEARDQEEINFTLEQFRNAVQRPEGLQERVDPERVQPFVGEYTNAELGSATLTLANGQLTLDAGVFQTELLPVIGDNGEVDQYIMTEPPIRGFPVEFRETDTGEIQMIVGQGTQEYTFIQSNAP